MNSAVYNIGVQLALADAGLIKEAATWAEAGQGAKVLAKDIGGSLKDFFTGRKVRNALKELRTASPHRGSALSRVAVPRDVAERALQHLKGEAKGGIQEATNILSSQLAKTPYEIAKSRLGKALLPYGVVGGLGALGGGGYAAYKGLYPDAGKWKLL